MRLSAPTQIVFFLALALAVVAFLGFFGVVAPIVTYAFWLMTAAWVLLTLGCLLKGF